MGSESLRYAFLFAGIGLCALDSSSAAQCTLDEDAKLAHQLGGARLFGASVALSRSRALVVAPSPAVDFSGWASIYEEQAGVWVLLETLTGAAFQDGFGRSGDLRGDVVVVGVNPPFTPGSVQVFEPQGGGWVHTQTLAPSDAADSFGQTVVLGDDVLLVGAGGAAYVFEKQGATWVESAKLVVPGGSGSLALAAGIAVVGAPGDLGSDPGAAFVFEKSKTGWELDLVLSADGGAIGDEFGRAVSLSDGLLVVGAPRRDGAGTDSGAAYVFEDVGGTWTQTAEIVAPDAASGDLLGAAVSVHGSAVLLGAPGDDDTGTAYVFRRHEGAWYHTAKLAASDGLAGDGFGDAVSLLGERALVGVPGAEGGSGVAYVLPTLCTALVGAPALLSLASGGSHSFALDAGPMHALALYLLLGTTAGTAPGQPLPPSAWTLPLNPSGYFTFTLLHPNTLIADSLAFLDASGQATATLTLAPGLDTALSGITLDHAFLVVDVADFGVELTSNAQSLALVP